jgi:hypothetical protein
MWRARRRPPAAYARLRGARARVDNQLMLNQIMNRLTHSGTAQGRRGGSRSTGRRAMMSRGRGAGAGGLRRGVRGRGQAPEQTLIDRLLHRR